MCSLSGVSDGLTGTGRAACLAGGNPVYSAALNDEQVLENKMRWCPEKYAVYFLIITRNLYLHNGISNQKPFYGTPHTLKSNKNAAPPEPPYVANGSYCLQFLW